MALHAVTDFEMASHSASHFHSEIAMGSRFEWQCCSETESRSENRMLFVTE